MIKLCVLRQDKRAHHDCRIATRPVPIFVDATEPGIRGPRMQFPRPGMPMGKMKGDSSLSSLWNKSSFLLSLALVSDLLSMRSDGTSREAAIASGD